jgi:hypothetical protein
LKSHEGVVLAAVQNDGHALQYADAALKRHEGVVLVAVCQTWRALMHSEISTHDIDVAAIKTWKEVPEPKHTCVFGRLGGGSIENADAWDKKVAQIDWGQCGIPLHAKKTLIDKGSNRPLDSSVVPYPKALCDRLFAFSQEKLEMPRPTLIVSRFN